MTTILDSVPVETLLSLLTQTAGKAAKLEHELAKVRNDIDAIHQEVIRRYQERRAEPGAAPPSDPPQPLPVHEVPAVRVRVRQDRPTDAPSHATTHPRPEKAIERSTRDAGANGSDSGEAPDVDQHGPLRDLVAHSIRTLPGNFSAAEILERVRVIAPPGRHINSASVFTYVSDLVRIGVVTRVPSEGKTAIYRATVHPAPSKRDRKR